MLAGLCQLYGYIHLPGYEALFQGFSFSRFSFFKVQNYRVWGTSSVPGTFSRFSFFKVFLFQGFPFLCFPFSRGCPCCLEDSCSRALFQELLMAFFQKVTIADKIPGLFRRHLFQDCSCPTFFKVMWGWF